MKKATNQSALLRKAVPSQRHIANKINTTFCSAGRVNTARSCKLDTKIFLNNKVKLSTESNEKYAMIPDTLCIKNKDYSG